MDPARSPLRQPCRPGGHAFPRAAIRAFTLVEILVTLAVASILLAFLYQVFVTQQRSHVIQEDVTEAQQNARVALDELSRFLTSLGSGAMPGQVRILAAHPYEIVFVADLDAEESSPAAAQTPGDPVPGARPDDPYQTIPGPYAASAAETYRFTLDANGDGVVDDADRTYEGHWILYREKNGGALQQVALLVANPRLDDPATAAPEEPLFRYFGDFDKDGDFELASLVDTATSPRLADGEPLDAVVRRIDVNLVAETGSPDPRFAQHDGYRQFRLNTSVTPRNLWDCPVVNVDPATVLPEYPRTEGRVDGTFTDSVSFLVTRGGLPERDHTVTFSVTGPSNPAVTAGAVTDGNGRVTATLTWPAACDLFATGSYVLAATSSELITPFGTCSPQREDVDLTVVTGPPRSVALAGTPVTPGNPPSADVSPAVADVASCGADSAAIPYRVLDYCAQAVRDADVGNIGLVLQPEPAFGTLVPNQIDQATGSVVYTSFDGPYTTYPLVSRSGVPPNPYQAWVDVDGLPGRLDLQVFPAPHHIVDLLGNPTTSPTSNIAATPYTDCPTPSGYIGDAFGVADACGNPLTSLVGNPFSSAVVEARLQPPAPIGTPPENIASTNNPNLSPTAVDIVAHNGTPGEFDIWYTAPTCGLGTAPHATEIVLTPTGNPAAAATLGPITVEPCSTCGVQVLDGAGNPTMHLNRDCEPSYQVEVTHCDVTTDVELVLVPISGAQLPSFDSGVLTERVTLQFDPATPVGAQQTATADLFMAGVDTGSSFRIAAYLPSEAAYNDPTVPSLMCESEAIQVDTSCSQLLISPTAANPRVVPSNPPAEDTILCGAEGTEVFVRVEDCDQNWRNYAADDLTNLQFGSSGILIQVLDPDPAAPVPVLDQERPDLFESDVDGRRVSDSPYFQGSLPITQDPADGEFSGLLRVPEGRIVLLRAQYRDPDDATDSRCEVYATVVPPVPVCLSAPVLSFGDWEGDLRVHGGDATVAGDLLLPASPRLTGKAEGAPLGAVPFGPDPEDRFFNAYVGGSISVGGTALPATADLDQPFRLGGSGSGVSTTHPNFFQRVPDTASLLDRLDYDQLKLIARSRKAYWVPELDLSGNWVVTNPALPQFGALSLADATRLPGPGVASDTHDGQFFFVDAPLGLQNQAAIDAAPLAALPNFQVAGPYFTEGLLYVAGSVTLGPLSGGDNVAVGTAAQRDSRYDEDAGGFTRQELPLDFDPASPGTGAGNLLVHLNGALYADGELRLPGTTRVYGVVAAERGVRDAGDAEIWYDPSWMESRVGICADCCGLAVTPIGPQVAIGDTLQLTVTRPQGAVRWESLDPLVATVDDTGLVDPAAEGSVVIRALDDAGCVAEVEVQVACGLSLESQLGTTLVPGDTSAVFAAGVKGSVRWETDTPAVLGIDRGTGLSVVAEALAVGAARISAFDTVGTIGGPLVCEAGLDFTVNCPGGTELRVTPENPEPGVTVTAMVLRDGLDVTAGYLIFADGTQLAGTTYQVVGTAAVEFEARLPDGTCPVGPRTVTPVCPAGRTLSVDPASPPQDTIVTLAVSDGGADVTGEYELFADGVRLVGDRFTLGTEPVSFEARLLVDAACVVGPLRVTPSP